MPLPFTALAQFIGNLFDRCESTPAPRLATAAAIGAYGERLAAAFLRRNGYRVLYRNYQTSRGEIDLVCRCGNLLVFVEVRTRASADFGRPVETIDAAKQDALRYAARRYLELLNCESIHYRFDAVEVLLVAGEIPICTLRPDLFS